jgi:hypothetical protein
LFIPRLVYFLILFMLAKTGVDAFGLMPFQARSEHFLEFAKYRKRLCCW